MIGGRINPRTGRRDDYNKNITRSQRIEISEDSKTGSLTTVQKDNLVTDGVYYRKLTVTECCRLQGVPDDYFKVSSNTQCYKMLGNGWQVDTIIHILKGRNQ